MKTEKAVVGELWRFQGGNIWVGSWRTSRSSLGRVEEITRRKHSTYTAKTPAWNDPAQSDNSQQVHWTNSQTVQLGASTVNSRKLGTMFPVWLQVKASPKEDLVQGGAGRSEPAAMTLWRSLQADGMKDSCRGSQPVLAGPSFFPLFPQLFFPTVGLAHQRAPLDAWLQTHSADSYSEERAYQRPLMSFPFVAPSGTGHAS